MNTTTSNTSPRLWNPDAAGSWSLLFSPAFGSYLQMLNWKELNEPELANRSRNWFAISVVVLGAHMLSSVAATSKPVDGLLRLLSFLLLLTWYFSSARVQAKYVREKFGHDYVKKSWWKPLGIALLCAFGCFVLVTTIVAFASVM